MDLRTKINSFLDFSNPYSIKKFLGVCEHEFNIISKKKDEQAFKHLEEMVEEVHTELEEYCKSNPNKKIYVKRVKGLLDYMRNSK